VAEVTDPDILKQFDVGTSPPTVPVSGAVATSPSGLVTDPEILKQFNAAPADKPTATADAIKEGAKGLGRGLASAAGDAGEAVAGPFGPSHHFANLMADLGLGDRPQTDPGYGQQITKAAGLEASPQTTAGRYAGQVGAFVGNPESYLGPGGMLAKAATAAGGAVGSEAAGELASSFAPDNPKVQAALRLVGAIAGGHGVTMAPRIVTPNVISDERQAMVNVLRNEKVPLRAGDVTGSAPIKAAESQLSPGINDAQDKAFKSAAFNRVGEPVGDRPILGQDGVVNSMMKRVGGQFDALAARNHVDVDPQLPADLKDIHDTFNSTPGLYPKETVKSVNGAIDRVTKALSGGSLSGGDYLTLRSNLRKAAQGSADSQRAEGLHDVTNALDAAMERTIQRTNPVDTGAWAKTNRDYRNALVLQDWAGAANMTPATLAQAAKRVYGKNQYVKGKDDFSDLAEAGRNVLKQYPDSGTASRFRIENMMSNVGGALGHALSGGGGYLAGKHFAGDDGVAGLLLGEAAGAFAMRPAARAGLMNPATQWLLSNQKIPYSFGTSPTMEALVNQIKGQPAPPPKKKQPAAISGPQQ
jgi:hypothetical protein